MERPNFIYRPYKPVIIEENFSNEVYWHRYPIYVVSRDKIKHYSIIRDVYKYFRKISKGKYKYYQKVLYTALCYSSPPYELTAEFEKEKLVLWSSDTETQEKIKQLFPHWTEIEAYYNDLLEYCKWKPEHDRQVAEQKAEAARIKEERRKKRELNDPDNPAARKRKARRHLQRLGYDLHKSRKTAPTETDKGNYQIVKLKSGKIVAGELFDLTLEQVEQFYMDKDLSKIDSSNINYMGEIGYMFNREINLIKRKQDASKALRKMGYVLEVAKNHWYKIEDGGNEYLKEYYKAECYVLRKNRTKSKYLMDKHRIPRHMSLEQVEKWILQNS